MILIDSPPLVAVTDATMISREIDKIIIIARANRTDKAAFMRSVNVLKQVDSPLGGVIMNGMSKASSYDSYYYYYQYYYYSEDGKKKSRKRRNRRSLLRKIFN